MNLFKTHLNRHQTPSKKWQKYQNQDVLPLWIADSDFYVAPVISDKLKDIVNYGAFGYGGEIDDLKQNFINYAEKHYNWQVKADWIVIMPGVVPSMSFARACSIAKNKPFGATVTPVYPHLFTNPQIINFNHQLAPAKLINNRWEIDFELLEQKITNETGLLLICHPHNPIGRAYSEEELLKYHQIAKKHDLIICSDEIHCDLILNNTKHRPIASLNDDAQKRTITLTAASKAYNIAGFYCSLAIIADDDLRNMFINQCAGLNEVNIAGIALASVAYQKGEEWLSEQIDYLQQNMQYLYNEINNIAGLSMPIVEATYLALINVQKLNLSDPNGFFRENGLGFSDGEFFGANGFVRLNFACDRKILIKAVDRINKAVKNLS